MTPAYCAPPALVKEAPKQPDLAGFLFKKSASFPWGWKRRYFTFYESCCTLSYWSSKTEFDRKVKPRGSLQVTGVEEVEGDGWSHGLAVHAGGFPFPDHGHALLVLRAASATERKHWLQAATTAFARQQREHAACPVLGPLASPRQKM